MKLKLDIYDLGAVMHVEFHQNVIEEFLSFGITVCHHSAILVMQKDDPQERYIYPTSHS